MADTSLAVKWVLEEDDSAVARDLLVRWSTAGIQPVVPSWFATEVANVLYKFVLRGELTVPDAQEVHATLMSLVVVQEDEPADAARAIAIAHAIRARATYDAQFAALAERLGCEMWTADERFWIAARGRLPLLRWIGNITP